MSRTIGLFLVLGLMSALGAAANEAEEDLLKAARKGDLDDLREAIFEGANINASDEDGLTALMWSVIKDEEETFDYLAVHDKVDLNRRDRRGNTALMHAVKEEQERSMNVLLTNDASPFVKDVSGYTPLQWALRKDYDDLIPRLRQAEADQKEKALRSEIARLKSPAPASGGSSSGQLDLEKQKLELERQKLNLEKEELHKARLRLEEERHQLKLDRETLEHERRRLEQRRRELEED